MTFSVAPTLQVGAFFTVLDRPKCTNPYLLALWRYIHPEAMQASAWEPF